MLVIIFSPGLRDYSMNLLDRSNAYYLENIVLLNSYVEAKK